MITGNDIKCYVYIIGAKHLECDLFQAIKIGISNDYESRLKSLQTSNHQELVILSIESYLSRERAIEMEGAIHQVLNKYLLRGEWFDKEVITMLNNNGYRFIPSIDESIDLVGKCGDKYFSNRIINFIDIDDSSGRYIDNIINL